MRTIAITSIHGEPLEHIQLAFPDAELVHLSLDRVEREARKRRLSALAVDPFAAPESAAALAVLKARYPELAMIGVVTLGPDVARRMLGIANANLDGFFVAHHDDHPNRYRDAFRAAAWSSVAHVVRRSYYPPIPVFASPNFERVVATI